MDIYFYNACLIGTTEKCMSSAVSKKKTFVNPFFNIGSASSMVQKENIIKY